MVLNMKITLASVGPAGHGHTRRERHLMNGGETGSRRLSFHENSLPV